MASMSARTRFTASSTPAMTYDFQKPYMETWLRLIGITDISDIIVEKTLFGAEVDIESRMKAKQIATALARRRPIGQNTEGIHWRRICRSRGGEGCAGFAPWRA